METKKAKQAVTLALDLCGQRGRFTKRDVAEEAHVLVKWDNLSLADRREALMLFLIKEAAYQMKAKLSTDIKDHLLTNVPPEIYPIFERLPKCICVSPKGGSTPFYVFTLYADEEDWGGFIGTIEVMEQKMASAKQVARDALALLKERGAGTIYEAITGQKVERQPFLGRPPSKPDDDKPDDEE